MPGTFSFGSNIPSTNDYLTLGALSRGSGVGVNNANEASAIASNQSIDVRGDVDVIAITLIAGQDYTFDIDEGAGDARGGSVDLEIDLIDARGRLIEGDSGSSGSDRFTFSSLDPLITFNVNQTGTYFLAVHSQGVDYVDGGFRFVGTGGTGDYNLVVSTPDIPDRTILNDANNFRSYGDARQNVNALGGNDTLLLRGGDDIGAGGSGNDSLDGGRGRDELSGGSGSDTLIGFTGNDVLVGGSSRDLLRGGDDSDALNGGSGNDALSGGGGVDELMGNTGDDILAGGSGADFLRGGDGVDRMTGGSGADTFHFLRGEANFDSFAGNGVDQDRIEDFQFQDVIDLSDVYSGRLTFIGSSAFSGANQVRVLDSGQFQTVQVNLGANRSTIELAFLVDTVGDFRLDGTGDFIF